MSGNLSAGIPSLLLEAAVVGYGVATLPEPGARSVLVSGALKVMLLDWTPKVPSVYDIYLSRNCQPDGPPLLPDAPQQCLGEIVAVTRT